LGENGLHGINLVHNDVIDWAKEYNGEKFHALLSDPPYHLTSIVKRFGKKGSAPAKDRDGLYQRASKGFMGQSWDGGDIAFSPETWSAIGEHLLPGALGMAFASSRGWHRLAVAIEDAGMIIHPSIFGWANGSGFPKATNPEKILNKRGDNRSKEFSGYRYGAQALKPSIEPIIIFQKPFGNNQIDNILRYGTGLYNIDENRIGVDPNVDDMLRKTNRKKRISETWEKGSGYKNEKNELTGVHESGRWPANFILVHEPGCELIGMKDDEYQINRFDNGAKPWGDAVGESFTSDTFKNQIPIWKCADGCPIKLLDLQTGNLGKSQGGKSGHTGAYGGGYKEEYYDGEKPGYGDSGGASRFFFQAHFELEQKDPIIYCAKASKREKDAGVEGGCSHPTIKPLSLTKHLASLLLPPQHYSPRRIVIPFAGTCSEGIGAYQAGWDEIEAIEKGAEYIATAKQRIEHWTQQPALI
jgi:site-specific DNA-methyltransferase (adenine-specific)